MLRRLLGGLAVVLVTFAVVLTVPLAQLLAARATQDVYFDRVADADRYAALAEHDLADGRTGDLGDELHQYAAVYGIRGWLLGLDGDTLASWDRNAPPPAAVLASPDVDAAEQGVEPPPPAPVTPSTSGDLLVAVPVGSGAGAIGAIVTLSPLGRLRAEVARRWALLGLTAALVTAALLTGTVPFSRWLLRPVARLDAAASEIAAGRLASRVGLAAGPPELRRLARSFNRMATVVERTLQRQQQFVSDASHQLRTPLTSLHLALENLGAVLPDDPEDPARAEHAEAIGEARAMARMFEGLLAITRLGAEPAGPEPVDDVVGSALVGWQARCDAAGLALELDVPAGLCVVAPPGGLRHLLDELVENACRLCGGSRVTVAGRTAGPAVEMSVRDDGRGLDAACRATATQRFWRAPDAQNTAGNGLGLAIVAELMAAADGAVDLRDARPGLEVVLLLRACSPGTTAPRPDGG